MLPQWPEGACEQESVPSPLCPWPTRAPAPLRAKPQPSAWPMSPHTACPRHLVGPSLTLLQHMGLLAVPPAPATALPQGLGTGCVPGLDCSSPDVPTATLSPPVLSSDVTSSWRPPWRPTDMAPHSAFTLLRFCPWHFSACKSRHRHAVCSGTRVSLRTRKYPGRYALGTAPSLGTRQGSVKVWSPSLQPSRCGLRGGSGERSHPNPSLEVTT